MRYEFAFRWRWSPTPKVPTPAVNCIASACWSTSIPSWCPGITDTASRLFQIALDRMGVAAEHAIYVGNDMHRDIYGAREVGMRTVMFDSDQGTKDYLGCVPDYRITDHRDLLGILGV